MTTGDDDATMRQLVDRPEENGMAKNVVVCLDGTNNQIRGSANTNVVRLYNMLDLSDASRQVAYYAPGVGTFSAPGAWTPWARTLSRLMGLAFGVGLRQELVQAYTYLMNHYEDDDRIFVIGFSRGAYTARALTGLLEVVGLFRPGAENLVPYAVAQYAKKDRREDWKTLRAYATSFSRVLHTHTDRIPVHFLGLWDTVKAAGTLRRQISWPYTLRLPRVATVRHAMAIDEKRRPYAPYPVTPLTDPAEQPIADAVEQDLLQVWFAGVHSDVGGMFNSGARLSDIPLKWIAQAAHEQGLIVVQDSYDEAMRQVSLADATGAPHKMGWIWALAGIRHRRVPPGANVHASVRDRIAADPSYARKVPDATFVDEQWRTSI